MFNGSCGVCVVCETRLPAWLISRAVNGVYVVGSLANGFKHDCNHANRSSSLVVCSQNRKLNGFFSCRMRTKLQYKRKNDHY